MAASRCATCGREEFLPFRCKLCAQPHCLDHRLPENHACPGLQEYRSRVREDRAFGLPQEPVEVRVRGSRRGSEAIVRARGFMRRSTTHLLLVLVLLTFLVQVGGGVAVGLGTGLGIGAGYELVTCALALGSCGPFQVGPFGVLSKPWSLVTSIFAHAGPLHLLFNALFLYFFGLEMERRVGKRMFTNVFFSAGVVAALGQAMLFSGPGSVVLGASGALMGVLGTLTILAPTMRVILFIVPAPLWVLTVFFVLLDLGGLFDPRPTGIANLAHLLGLAVGFAWGLRLRQRGVLPRVASTWASQRKF